MERFSVFQKLSEINRKLDHLRNRMIDGVSTGNWKKLDLAIRELEVIRQEIAKLMVEI